MHTPIPSQPRQHVSAIPFLQSSSLLIANESRKRPSRAADRLTNSSYGLRNPGGDRSPQGRTGPEAVVKLGQELAADTM